MPAVAFCWPFAYFGRRLVAWGPTYASIENDFMVLYYNYKVYLLDCLSHLRLPLWSPSEAAGYPFYSNPFTQAFYPLNVPLTVVYALRGGYTPLDHQRFAVLGVAILSLGLWVWLRGLGQSPRAALFAALCMSVSFKIAEALRFPNAVHAAAWYPWILFSCTRLVWAPETAAKLGNAVLLCLFSICLLTAGYPYYAYYGLFLFVPYVAMLFVPPLSRRLTGAEPRRPAFAFAALTGAGLGVALVCGPYLRKMNALLRDTADRTGGNWEYATAHPFTPLDTLGSLVYPPAAETEGWFYFGLAGLLLAALYVLDAPGSRVSRLVLLGWFGTIAWITYGADSALFALLWDHLPGFSRLRVWARLNVVLVPLLAWLVASGYSHFEATLASHRGSPRRRRALTVLVAAYVLFGGAQLALHHWEVRDPYWQYFHNLDPVVARFVWLGAASFLVLVALIGMVPQTVPGSRRSWTVVGIVAAMAAIETASFGPWLWAGTRYTRERWPLEVAGLNEQSFRHPRTDRQSTVSLSATFSVGVIDNWHLARYVRFLKETEGQRDRRDALLGLSDARKVFFSERLDHATIADFLDDADRFEPVPFQVGRYTGDTLSIRIRAPRDGFVTFIDNWDPDWKADIDGRAAPIERLFGTFKSVRVTEGRHRVHFRYRPRLWGTAGAAG